MSILILIIISVITIAYLLYDHDIKKQIRRAEEMRQEIEEEAGAMALKVTTISKLEALQSRIDEADIALSEKETPARLRKALLLEEAFDIASEQTVKWQYTPELNPSLSSEQLKQAYKLFSIKMYEEKHMGIDGDEANWTGLAIEDAPEDPEDELPFLKKLVSIIESDRSDASKIKSINTLATKMIDDVDNLGLDAVDDDGAVNLGENLKEDGRF